MTDDPHPWAGDLVQLHAQIWTRLVRGVGDRKAATRHPTLATVAPDGKPQARTVVLRAADPQTSSLDIHTDLHSAKVSDLRATPFATLHVWDASAHLQLRLEGQVTILTGQDVTEIWAKVPEAARLSYGSTPTTGHPLGQALDYSRQADPACFVVLRLAVQSIDALHLGPDHRRAKFARTDDWRGMWLVP